MGATLDIQRQQRMDMLDQQLLLAQYSESRRNARRQQQVGKCAIIGSPGNKLCKNTHMECKGWANDVRCCVQGGLLQWTRLFPTLRHRGQNRPPMQPHPQAQTPPSTQQPPRQDNSLVAEEQVGVLVVPPHFHVSN